MFDPKISQARGFPAQRSGSENGFYLDDLADGAVVEIETQHSQYRLGLKERLAGHPTFCPEPVEVEVEGSIASGPTLTPTPGFIGRGMYMVFKHPRFDRAITTSRIREIHMRG